MLYRYPYLAKTEDYGIPWANNEAFRAVKEARCAGMVLDPVTVAMRSAADNVVRHFMGGQVTKDNAVTLAQLLLRTAGDRDSSY